MLCQAEEGLLLGVSEGEGFETAEDNRVCWNVLIEEVSMMDGATYGMPRQPSIAFQWLHRQQL
jgi:hypothetical protein